MAAAAGTKPMYQAPKVQSHGCKFNGTEGSERADVDGASSRNKEVVRYLQVCVRIVLHKSTSHFFSAFLASGLVVPSKQSSPNLKLARVVHSNCQGLSAHSSVRCIDYTYTSHVMGERLVVISPHDREASVVVHNDRLILQTPEIASYLLFDGLWKIRVRRARKLVGRKFETLLEYLPRVHGGKAERPACPHQGGVTLREWVPGDLWRLSEREGAFLDQMKQFLVYELSST